MPARPPPVPCDIKDRRPPSNDRNSTSKRETRGWASITTMSATTRHRMRRTLREAEAAGIRDNDDYEDNERSRGLSRPSRVSVGKAPQQQRLTMQSSAVLQALSDAESELARFLFIGADRGSGQNENGSSPWFMSFRRYSNQDDARYGDKDDMPAIGKMRTYFYALALEPVEVRNERLIMMFEAISIFGALFMGAVWIIYEWGSAGVGEGGEDGGEGFVIFERIFECIMAVALAGNIFLALFGGGFWIHSLVTNSSNEDFYLKAVTPLSFLFVLLEETIFLVFLGMVFGTVIHFRSHWPEAAVALTIIMLMFVKGWTEITKFGWETIPLEFYHSPGYHKWTHFKYWSKKNRDELKCKARARAKDLKKCAYRERKKLDPNFRESESSISASPIGVLLATAATNMGVVDCDVSMYESQLREDWLFSVDQLKGRSVECLSRYMPLGLAEEVKMLADLDNNNSEHNDNAES